MKRPFFEMCLIAVLACAGTASSAVATEGDAGNFPEAADRRIFWGAGAWWPEGDGTYEIALTATTDDIGEVAIAVEPAGGALALAANRVDFAGGTTATIVYTLSGAKEGDSFLISATPADATVAALADEDAYDVTVSGPYLSLWCDAGAKFTTDTTDIFLALTASPSKYGTYTPVSSELSVVAPSRETIAVPDDYGDSTVWFGVSVKGGGTASVSLAEDPSVKWNFEIADVRPIDLAGVATFEAGALKIKVPENGTILFTTNLVTGSWAAYSAEAGEDGEVAIPTTGPGAFYRIGEPPSHSPVAGAANDWRIITHVVEVGDHMYKICSAHDLTYSLCKNAIMVLNGFTQPEQLNNLTVGQVIKLPASNEVVDTFTAAAGTGVSDGRIITHVVSNGEYLFKICKAYNLDYYQCKNSIMLLNGFTKTEQLNNLRVGQTIKLPASNEIAATVTAADAPGGSNP